jgi:hypothetical protein
MEISPPYTTYTVTETGSVNQITCTADCNPNCITTWTGPNLPAGSTSILNLQNIDRSQAGVYNCTAVNAISSLTLIKVNIIVNCKYEMPRLFDIYVFYYYHCWWTISPRRYHPPSSQCFYHCVYLAWWTICLREYHLLVDY